MKQNPWKLFQMCCVKTQESEKQSPFWKTFSAKTSVSSLKISLRKIDVLFCKICPLNSTPLCLFEPNEKNMRVWSYTNLMYWKWFKVAALLTIFLYHWWEVMFTSVVQPQFMSYDKHSSISTCLVCLHYRTVCYKKKKLPVYGAPQKKLNIYKTDRLDAKKKCSYLNSYVG